MSQHYYGQYMHISLYDSIIMLDCLLISFDLTFTVKCMYIISV